MKKLLALLALSSGAVLFVGCETTGDPNAGGIFWSERKAQQRLADREQRLDDIDHDTSRVKRRNRRMENQLR
ncbi:MAG TPA: hypothetical protein VF593_06845 [Chthoniobacteraceae bacterium]|jgi:hypothetical protein